jgi:hypothetical protein
VEGTPARIVDISYGGIRFELERQPDRTPPSSFRITLPTAQLSVTADLVWTTPIASHTWICGAAITPDSVSADWQGLVDALN